MTRLASALAFAAPFEKGGPFLSPKVESPSDKRELEELCRAVREAMGAGDKKKMEEASSALNDRLLNYAYLL